ncbi:MAG: GTPase HflX [Actinomycetota bacterium]
MNRRSEGSDRRKADVDSYSVDRPRVSRRRITELPPELQQLKLERAVLVGLSIGGRIGDAEESLEELKRLTDTAGAQVIETLVQRRDRPDPATFLGKGKADEVRSVVRATGADTVIVDEELSPGQLRNLEELCGCKVIDRTALIIDIFAQHAHSAEGKLQVELAQLNYLLPRLRGWGESMSRMGKSGVGGLGTRGPGETKLESDRRRIGVRLAKLKKELKDVARVRQIKRAERVRARTPAVVLVGYTNAGKSTLLNAMTRAGVLVQDQLFSTLDPTTRRLDLPDGRSVTLTDTVGFVRKLPHTLVEAFKSTLEEATDADLLVHIVDGTAEDPDLQHAAVREVLGEIGAAHVPELVVINKNDLLDEVASARLRRRFADTVLVSALAGEGIDGLLEQIAGHIPPPEIEASLLVPYDRGAVVAALHAAGAVLSEEFTPDGTKVRVRLREDQAGRLAEYRLPEADARSERST